MDNRRSSFLSWLFYCQAKSTEELRQTLLYTTLELESTKLAAQEEINKRDDRLTNLKELLNRTMRERDEALEKFQKLLLEKLIFQQHDQQQQQYQQQETTLQVNSGVSSIEYDQQHQNQQHQQHQQQQNQQQETPQVNSGISIIEDDQHQPRRGIDSSNGFSSSDCEESIVSSPPPNLPENTLRRISGEKPLPEKGKLLEAVMKAGPLLQTLLLAGPLPQWRHPPPPLETFEIPPVRIPAPEKGVRTEQEQLLINGSNCGIINWKRGYLEVDCCDDSSSCPDVKKYQRVFLH